MQSRMSARPAMAAPGRPPAAIFARAVRSGRTPKCAWAPPGATRKPVTTSSKMRTTLWRCGAVADEGEEVGVDGDRAHRGAGRLEDDGGDVALVGEGVRQRLVAVLGDDDLLAEDGGRDAGRTGDRLAGQDVADDAVVPAVEVEGEADELVAAGEGAGESDGHHGGLGAGGVEAHLLGGRDELLDPAGPLELELVAGAVVRALGDLTGDGADERLVGVAEEEGAVAEDVVDYLVAVDVRLAGAGGVVDVDGEGREVTDVVGDAVGEDVGGLLVEGLRAGVQRLIALKDGGHAGLSILGTVRICRVRSFVSGSGVH